MEHTKTPWYVSPQSNYIRANGVHGWNIAKMEQDDLNETNAAYIVKAVNSHEELVENLSRLINRIKENGWNEYIPSAYDRAKEILQKVNANT